MSKTILWLDNDPRYIEPYVLAATDHGYKVKVVTSVSAAETLLREQQYSLVIIDAMIPTRSEEEENLYPPEETDRGLKMGVMFYKRVKEVLDAKSTAVLVMTVRLDEAIHDEFKKAGLAEESFATKLALRKANSFLDKIDSLANRPISPNLIAHLPSTDREERKK